jgi:5-methylcytosine-specific restriction endonuclease McrA
MYHKKECVICGENKIVAVHHYDENHNNDSIENLIPLCPTHHNYVHSRYKDEVIDTINKYREEFISKNNLGT